MIYLGYYIAIGLGALIAALAYDWISSGSAPWSASRRSLWDRTRLEGATWRERMIIQVVPLVGGALLLLLAWPLAPLIWIRAKFPKKGAPEPEDCEEELENVFAVARGDLLQRMSVDEIEQRERVVDPLGAVPDLPFGHLHAAWKKFRDGIEPQDELWSFTAEWRPELGQHERRLGYVIGRGNEFGQHFVTKLIAIPDPVQQELYARFRARRLLKIAGAQEPE